MGVLSHLWQSTVFAGVAGLLTLALRTNQAKARYWLWVAASMKFLVPFSLLIAIGAQLGWMRGQVISQPALSFVIEEVSQPFLPAQDHPRAPVRLRPGQRSVATVCITLWFFGAAIVLFHWVRRWRRIAALIHGTLPLRTGREVETLRRLGSQMEIRSSDAPMEPGVFGIMSPVLFWPSHISGHLTDAQLEAILVHEVSHVRRRDNLFAALHMLVEAVYWFHPLVWWMGSRLVEEREHASDEDVLLFGGEPRAYAEGVLKTCRLCLESPLTCVSGVTGSDLTKRIEKIMKNRPILGLDVRRKLLLAVAGLMALAGPIVIGMANAPRLRGQTSSVAPAFEVASIKAAKPGTRGFTAEMLPGGRFVATNVTLKMLIADAYKVYDFQIVGGPAWLESQRFSIDAKPDVKTQPTNAQVRKMLQALLADRFQLKLHRDSKESPVYSLVIGKRGSKLEPAKEPDATPYFRTLNRRQIIAKNAPIEFLTEALSTFMGRPVVDKTELKGGFDYNLLWTPDETQARAGDETLSNLDPERPSIFNAMQEQLGLKLEAQRAPVEFMIVERAEKPSEN